MPLKARTLKGPVSEELVTHWNVKKFGYKFTIKVRGPITFETLFHEIRMHSFENTREHVYQFQAFVFHRMTNGPVHEHGTIFGG